MAVVVEKVECDLQISVNEEIGNGHSYLDDWAAAFVLTLKVEEQGGLAIVPVTAAAFPISGGMFNLNFGASATSTSRRTAVLKFAFNLHDVRSYTCSEHVAGGHPLIAGDLGIREWLHRSLTAIGGTDVFKVPTEIDHTTEFQLVANGALGPNIVLARFTGTGSLTAQRTDTDTLDLVLTEIPPEPSPTKVVIVGPILEKESRSSGVRQMAPLEQAPSGRALSTRVSPAARERLDRALQGLELRTLLPQR